MATAPMVRAISAVGRTRSSMSVLMAVDFRRPLADRAGQRHALAQAPVSTDRHAQTLDLARNAILMRDGLVERLRNSPFRSRPIRRQPAREIAVAKRGHRRKQHPRATLRTLRWEWSVLFPFWLRFPLRAGGTRARRGGSDCGGGHCSPLRKRRGHCGRNGPAGQQDRSRPQVGTPPYPAERAGVGAWRADARRWRGPLAAAMSPPDLGRRRRRRRHRRESGALEHGLTDLTEVPPMPARRGPCLGLLADRRAAAMAADGDHAGSHDLEAKHAASHGRKVGRFIVRSGRCGS